MFNTTLTDEFLKISEAFELDSHGLDNLIIQATNASLLPGAEKKCFIRKIKDELVSLRDDHL